MKKNQQSQHYWRIHAKVAKRLWSEIPLRLRDAIASDTEHLSEEFKWFESKVANDTKRLYEDPNYYDNQESTFRIPKHEPTYLINQLAA